MFNPFPVSYWGTSGASCGELVLSHSTFGGLVAALNSSSYVVIYPDSTNSSFLTAVISNISCQIGTPFVISDSINGGTPVLLDSSHYVVVFVDDTNNHIDGVVCTFSGITTTVVATSAIIASFGDGGWYFVIAMDATHFIVAYSDQFNVRSLTAVACSVSGTTITVGTPVVINASTISYQNGLVASLDASHFVILYNDGTNSNYLTAVVGTISGTTLSLGTPLVLQTVGALGNFFLGLTALDTTHFVATYQDLNNSTFPTGVVCSVSGTVITAGSPVVLAATTDTVPAGGGSIFATQAVALNSSHFVALYPDSANSDFMTSVRCSVAGLTITIGVTAVLSHNVNSGAIAALSSSKYVVAYENSVNSNYLTGLVV